MIDRLQAAFSATLAAASFTVWVIVLLWDVFVLKER